MLYTVKDRRSDYLPSFGVMMDDHDAAVVFTSEAAARSYVSDLGTMYRAVELRSHVLLDFLLRLRIEGVKEIMVDPTSTDDPNPLTISTFDVLRGATDCIESTFAAAIPAERGGFDRLTVVTCSHCHRTDRISKEDTLPVCCGAVMKVAATEGLRTNDPEATLAAEKGFER